MERTFICQVVPKQLTSKLNVSQAANNFCFNLIDANCFSSVLSLVPINIIDKIKGNDIDYIQYRGFSSHKGLFKLLNSVIESFVLAKKVKKSKNIWFYNVTPHNFLSILILKFLYKKKNFLILADYTPSKKFFSIQRFIKIFIEKNVSGIISLSGRVEFSNKNMLNLAGIVPLNKIYDIKLSKSIKKEFLFSGRLEDSTGWSLAIEVFSKLPDCTLIITGHLSKDKIEEISKYKNIKYLGLLSYDEYLKLLNKIPFNLNLRNPSFDKNLNNFPSKILEAFSYNRIVLSTFKYNELNGFKYFYCKYDSSSLRDLLINISKKAFDELKDHSNHSLMLEKSFSEIKWKKYLTNIEKNKNEQ